MIDEALPGDGEFLRVRGDGDFPHETEHGFGDGDGVGGVDREGASGFTSDELGEGEIGEDGEAFCAGGAPGGGEGGGFGGDGFGGGGGEDFAGEVRDGEPFESGGEVEEAFEAGLVGLDVEVALGDAFDWRRGRGGRGFGLLREQSPGEERADEQEGDESGGWKTSHEAHSGTVPGACNCVWDLLRR